MEIDNTFGYISQMRVKQAGMPLASQLTLRAVTFCEYAIDRGTRLIPIGKLFLSRATKAIQCSKFFAGTGMRHIDCIPSCIVDMTLQLQGGCVHVRSNFSRRMQKVVV